MEFNFIFVIIIITIIIALTTRHPSIRKKLALTSPTSGGHSVGIVRSRTKASELVIIIIIIIIITTI
jgi:hypothetical protein